MTCRIIVADDHPLFREAMVSTVRRLLPEAELEQAGSLQDVLRLVSQGTPADTLILDLRFPGLTCIGRLAELRRQMPRTTLIIASMVDDPDVVAEVMAAGADGFIGKSLTPDEIAEAILAIREGDVVVRYAPSGLLPQMGADSELEQLTHRQQDVLRLIAQGKTNKEIARELDISPFTVRIHVSSLLKTLNVPTRTAAAVKYSGS
ncbi:LuxR C-terminal-related transcriptional regulator [Pseudomonas xantholysinigenes]|uniref:Response regulator transcription factor n=1 Tax=Pseudomonas xantholysinigenes TaxID=2745490 RepID=A0A9E6Q059_9PSED|nr:response regulator transcription factor [Pseudomonas xantholysinigenes]QXI40785.1 response regulator transcription factor [Pseudomonas xantholysinigenes]